ncbi:hypothetical protein T484DRAFT_1915892 [Baffinella frigidus]|nr:hypothetical protein T484DRAFT_1915892 [Cryptophyta sp. CCMP2293]
MNRVQIASQKGLLAGHKALLRWSRGSLVRALNIWRELCAEQVRTRGKTSQVIERWSRTSIASAWDSWAQAAFLAHANIFLFDKGAGHFCHSSRGTKGGKRQPYKFRASLCAAWDAWTEATQDAAGRRDIFRSIFQRWNIQTLMHALDQWTARWNNQTLLHALDKWKAAQGDLNRDRVVSERVLQRWQTRYRADLAAAFTEWMEHTIVSKTATLRALKGMRRWIRSGQAKGFAGWAESVAEAKRLRRTMTRVAGMLMRGALSRCVRNWGTVATKAQSAALYESIQHLREKAQDRVKVVVQRIVHRHAWAAFSSWAHFTVQSKHCDTLSERVLGRWLQKSLAAPFHTWVDSAAKSARLSRIKDNDQVLSRLRLPGLAAAFGAWEAYKRRKRKAEVIAERTIGRWFIFGAARAFPQWRAAAEVQAGQREAVRGVMFQLLNAMHQAAFEGRMVEAREMAFFRIAIKGAEMRRLVGMIVVWALEASSRALDRRLCAKATNRWIARATPTFLAQWHLAVLQFTEAVAAEKHAVKVSSNILQRWAMLTTASALEGWRLAAQNLKPRVDCKVASKILQRWAMLFSAFTASQSKARKGGVSQAARE